jgi:hypothetical protein
VNQRLMEELMKEIRSIAHADPDDLQTSIEACLERRLRDFDPRESLAIVEQLVALCEDDGGAAAGANPPAADFSRLTSLLLGRRITPADHPAAELSERLAQALGTVFDTLNEIVAVIQRDLLGQREEQETIRQIISSQIRTPAGDNSLQEYLDQIKEAFLVSHKASLLAAEALVRELLAELDPAGTGSLAERRLTFGLLRKAELFEIYREKFGKCKAALESGRLTERFLREFEKASQKIYGTARRKMV